VIFKVTCSLKPISHILENIACINCDVLSQKARMVCNFNCVIEIEGLANTVSHILYVVNVAIPKKTCQIDLLLLRTNSRK